jgi:hypothetical protein
MAEPLLATASTELVSLLQATTGSFVRCVVPPAINGSLPLYVAHPAGDFAHRIHPGVLRSGCCAGSLIDWVSDGRWCITRSRMHHDSLEARLDGGGIFARRVDVTVLGLRRTSKARVTAIIQALIDVAEAAGARLTRDEVEEHVIEHPDVWDWLPTPIGNVFDQLKPEDWKKPGPRRKLRKK